jgi:hypothetical protein
MMMMILIIVIKIIIIIIATLWTGGSNPGGARFSAPILTGSGAHPASCTMGTVSFPGVKTAGA